MLLQLSLVCSFVVGCFTKVPLNPDCLFVKCMAPACTNPHTPPGKCCPMCPHSGCVVKGVHYNEGASVTSMSTHPCEVCYCNNGSVQCSWMMCPDCVGEVPPGQCCPLCASEPSDME
ncbi:kielin/chordin-like protein [Dreissena polymorpha]|uniref:VWFC domain-containing protein n=1 Tax=Dreissena polymorpha TaxID=45954 RepID=A0A9D4H061_DREPO|nr:kielin/chordin-like protein [Dreissena polymorpha]XP_052212995.1 kielin/chordin-like protein [Dreissena polymorpha]KAH3826047.1 hypothetical protein DPMN_127936 [Dreissena polymorpha]